jgi:3-hydroxyisobutyrate dehydrogenase
MTDTQTAQPAGRGLVTETIAVLGAGGIMGFPIARNIARSGLPVRAWNRSRGTAGPLAADGAYLARSPRDAASGAGIVITMLADEDAVVRAMNGPDGALRALAGRHPHHALWVQMSTIGEAATRRCAELADLGGVGFVDAPVLGTRQPAEEGRLVILESGPEEARHRLTPVFGAIGQSTIRAGDAGAGSRLKAVLDYLVLAVVEAGAETTAVDLPLIEALARRYAEAVRELVRRVARLPGTRSAPPPAPCRRPQSTAAKYRLAPPRFPIYHRDITLIAPR